MLAAVLVAATPQPAAAHAGDDCVLFSPADVAENDWFGSSVGVDGDTAVITSWIAEEDNGPVNAGAAYVYDRQPDGSWVEGQKLLPSNPGPAYNFGFSADIEGDIIAIGAWHEKVGAAGQAGAVYIYERPGPGGVWSETARLTAGDPNPDDGLGYNLEVDAGTSSVIVGAQQDDEGGNNAGAAYVFRKTNGTWAQEAKLLDPNANGNDRAGNDVAIFGDWAVVGHHLDDVGINGPQTNAGGALLYQRTGTTWAAPIELDVSNPEAVKNRAGYGVDIDGDLLVMTSYHDFDTQVPQGWVFRLNNGVWTEEQQFFPYPSVNAGDHPFATPDNDDGTHFGRHVELDNGVIAVGSSYDSSLDFERGATHYWTQDANGLWKETARIDPEGNAKYFHAGIAVGLSDNFAIIGAEKGNTNDDGVHEPFGTSPDEIFNSGLACIADLTDILDGTHSPNPFYEVYVSVGDATVAEGNPGDTNQAAVDITLSKAAPSEVTVEISTTDGSATLADSDYTQVTSQVVTFAPGEVTKTVPFDVTGDYNTEANETFLVELANPTTGVLIEDGLGQVTVTDEDVLELNVGDVTVAEGDSGTTAAVVDVSLPFPTTIEVTADLITIDGTATVADNDYTPFDDTITFAVGDQTKQVSIDLIGDGFIEGDETFTLEITGSSPGSSIADGSGLITITGDDANSVSIGDATVTEGDSGPTTATVDVTLTEPAAFALDVTVSAADGTATLSDGDYQASTQTVSFAVGEDTKSVSFTVNGDDVPEADETFTAELSNPTGGVTIADGSGTITITNDDAPTVSIADGETVEGAIGDTTLLSIDVTLSAPAVAPVSVTVDTADGTATSADSDYTPISAQVVSFAVGELTKTVTVEVLGDDTAEPNENLTLGLSNPTGGLTIADGTGTIDIFDDDSVAVVVGDAVVVEGASGTTDTVTVEIALTQPAAGQVDVTIATADGTATTADGDYVALSEVVTFADGESDKTVTITVNGDDGAEADEVFLVQASNVVGAATIADGTGEVTITNDDTVAVSIADGSTLEGDAGPSSLLLDVTLSGPASETVTVEVDTVDGSATVAGNDYVAVAGQVLTFAPGETAKQISIPVVGDENFEDNEDFTVTLSNPSAGLTIADGTATATITNDEVITVSVGDATIPEGDSGTSTVSVDVTLSDPADQVMTVQIDTADITATVADNDYVAPGPQTVTFQPSESSKTVDITVNGDTAIEPNETFSVIASNPTGDLVLGDATGVVTITNDDTPNPTTVTIGDVTVDPEGTGPNGTASVTVSLSQPAQVPITLDVSTGPSSPESATAGDDYTAIVNQPLAFAVGEQSKVVTIDIVADSLHEVNETFQLVGSNLLGTGASFAQNIGEITIVDDDPITVSVADVTVTETDFGANNLLMTFTLNGPSFQTVVINYATQDGTATVADVDYVAKSGEVRFAPGVTVLTRGLQYIGDTNEEDDEFFEVVLSDPINAQIGQGTATVTILDDDVPPPFLTVGDATVDPEGDTGSTTTATIDLTLDIPATGPSSVDLVAVDGTATLAGGDFQALSQTVTFAEGEQAKTVTVTVVGDDEPEINEKFTIVASNPVGNIDFADDTGEVTIVDDDGSTIATPQDVTVSEGDAADGTTDVTVTVNLSQPAPGPMTVDLTTSDGTAEAGVGNPDYVAGTETVSFNTGDTSGTATFQIVADDIAEEDETFLITASNPTGGLLAAVEPATVTITNDDVVEVSVTGIAITERDAGARNAIVTFSLSKPSSVSVSVDYNTVDGTATLADNDYVERLGEVRFPPLATTRTRGFTIVGDEVAEENETFSVTLTNPVNALLGTDTDVVTILDDDTIGNPLTVADVTVAEGDAGTTTVDVVLQLDSPAASGFTVDVETLNGTAMGASDFVAIDPPQTVSFAAGDLSQTVTLNVTGDTTPEADETFGVVLSNISTTGIVLADNTGRVTILNDDPIGISVGDATVTEGAAGTTVDATVTVSLSQPAIGTMTVNVSTLDGSAATGDGDYVAASQTLVFADGEQTKDLVVTVNGDDNFEIDETFSVVVGTTVGDLTVIDGAGEVTIVDDEVFAGPISALVGGVTVDEPDTGATVNATVDITLTEPATAAVSLDIASVDGTATVADGDYLGTAEVVSFAIGEQSKQVTVVVNGDDAAEFDETFTLVASNPSAGLAILDDTGEVVIVDNDQADAVNLTVTDVAVLEGNTGSTTAAVNLVLDQPPVFPVSVQVSTADGSATLADGDFTAISGQTVTFGSGVQSQIVNVDVTGDTTAELDESFFLIASNPGGALNFVDDTGEITILTDDAIMVSVGDVVMTEIDAGFRWAQVPFTLTAPPANNSETVTVQFTTVDGTATLADNDYEARSGELRFGAGVTSLTRGVRIYGDQTPEANEILTVELSAPVNAILGDGVGQITVLDDDTDVIGLTIGDLSIPEGDTGTSVASVNLTLDSPAVNEMTVDVVTADGTATAGSDYVAVAPQTVTFSPGDVAKTVDITINGDTAVEADETFELVGSNASFGMALVGDGTGTVTILHDDQPRLTLSDVTVAEGNAGTTTAAVLASLDRPPTEEMTVVVSTVDGSATVANNDYTAVGETLTFAVGEQSKAVNVFITGDGAFENDEQLSVVASNPSTGLVIDDDTGVITVTNDDAPGGAFALIVGDASVIEGPDGATTVATVDVSLSFPSPGGVTVDIATADDSATVADGDYVAVSQTLTFAQNEQSKQVQITVNGDGDEEADESLNLVASNPTGGLTISDGTGVVNILNDDVANLQVSVGDVDVIEGEAGTVIATVPVTLNKPSPVAVSVDINTVDDTATVADNDYVAVAGQVVTFAAGEVSQTVDVTVNGDTTQELNETFNLVASNPSAELSLGDDTGVVTIVSDDGVTISVADVTMTEIDAGFRWAQVTFTLSDAPGSNTFTVDYATQDGTATVANGDYEAKSGELRFANNRTSLTRGFKVFGDTVPEANEVFSVVLSNPFNGSIADGTGEITILDDDNTGIGLSLGDVTVTEGNAGTTIASVPLTLDIPALGPLSVDVSTVDGTATANDGDFTLISNEQVVFAVGEQTKNVNISVTGDTNLEDTEAFTLKASNPSAGLVLLDDTGEITVTNDDFPANVAALTVGDVSVVEGQSGTTTATVTLSLDQTPALPVTVTIDTVDGTATTADADYNPITAQTVTFGTNETSKTVPIVINGDTTAEVNETFTLVASNPTPGSALALADDTGEITIETDDAIEISVGDVTLTEINGGFRWAQVPFTLSAAPGSNTVTVDYTTVDGSATIAGGDYAARSGELRFVNNNTTLTRGFKVFGDTLPELNEVFNVVLSNPVNGVIADGSGDVTIIDNDTTGNPLSVGDATVVEGDAGTTSAVVDLTLASPAVVPMTVDVATADGTATTADGDYTPVTQQISFAVGETVKQVTIDVTGDTNIETDETFTVVASNPSVGLILANDTGEVTITNDDIPPTLDVTVTDVSVAEGNTGQTTAATVQLDLSQAAVIPVSVDLSTVDGTATEADADFNPIADQTVTFAAGESSKTVDIDIIGDDTFEFDETFEVTVSNPSPSLNVVDGTAEVTITNDDAQPTLSVIVTDATVTEGDTGPVSVTVDVNLTAPAVAPVSVEVATTDGTATAGADYTAVSQTVNFAIGDTGQQVTIDVLGDTDLEGDEDFTLVASNPSPGLDILDGTGVVTITDDELLVVNVGDQTIVEGNTPDTAVVSVPLTLSDPAVAPVTVVVDTVDGTATTADGDYVAITAQTVTFPTGSSSQTVDITITGDDVIEGDEAFSLVASAPSAGLTLGDTTGVVTIESDDQPGVSIGDVSVLELNGGYKWAQVRFSLSAPSTETVVIEYTTFDGTATAGGGDYTPRTQVLSFAPGKTELFRGIQVLGDTEVEGDEFFTVELVGPPVNAVVIDGVGQIDIEDNDD